MRKLLFSHRQYLPQLKSHFLSFPQADMNFLAWNKNFCQDKKYFVWADGWGISVEILREQTIYDANLTRFWFHFTSKKVLDCLGQNFLSGTKNILSGTKNILSETKMILSGQKDGAIVFECPIIRKKIGRDSLEN